MHPETPDEGLTLEQLFAGRNIDIPAAQKRMKRLMQEEGLPYGDRTMTFNSRRAQELATWAETQPGGEQIHTALFSAYFVSGRNISQLDVLHDVTTSIGLNGNAAIDAVESRTFREKVDTDWAESRQSNITGVPTFVAEGRCAVGAQPYQALERLAKQAGAASKIQNDRP